MPPPPIHYVVLLFASFAFAIGLAFYVATTLGSRHRKGARLGIVLGAPLSVSAGILAGCFSWAISEDWHLPDLLYLTWGPLCGTFTVTLAMSFLAREIAVMTFRKLASRSKAGATEDSLADDT